MELAANNIASDRIEKAVHLGLFRIAWVRERLQSSSAAQTLTLVQLYGLSSTLVWAVHSLERIEQFPNDRDELCDSLNELLKFREKANDSVCLATQRGLSSLFLGRAIEDRLKSVASVLDRVVDAWTQELNGRFPELFSAFDVTIDSIRANSLPNIGSSTLELASQALSKTDRERAPTQTEIDDWARALTEDFLSKND